MAMRKSACHLPTVPNETVVLQDEISGIAVQKGVAFRDTLLALRIIQWIESERITGATGGRGNCTEYRTVYTEDAWPVICEEMPGCRETRHPGIFSMCFCLVVSIIRFPGPAFPPVRLQRSFARCRKQEACHGLQRLCSICMRKIQSFRISPRSWPRWQKCQCDQPLP